MEAWQSRNLVIFEIHSGRFSLSGKHGEAEGKGLPSTFYQGSAVARSR